MILFLKNLIKDELYSSSCIGVLSIVIIFNLLILWKKNMKGHLHNLCLILNKFFYHFFLLHH